MKKLFFLTAGIVLFVSACSRENLSGISRGSAGKEPETGILIPDRYVHNTTILLAGVEVPENYDWRRDTLGGTFNGKLVLFKNFKREMELEISPSNEISPDYDTHFLIGERLYTLFRNENSTVVKCDGRTILRTGTKEILKGLLPTSDGVYTLCERPGGQDGDDIVLVLRLDDETVGEYCGKSVFGSMSDDACGPSGALYRDNGKIYFCYTAEVAGAPAYYVVENARERVLSPPMDQNVYSIRDIKVENGTINYLTVTEDGICLFRNGEVEMYETGGTMKYYDGRLLRNRETTTAIGEFRYLNMTFGRMLFHCPSLGKQIRMTENAFVIQGEGGASALINYAGKKHMVMTYLSGGWWNIPDSSHCFSSRCGFSLNKKSYLALTPVEKGRKPYIWVEGDTTEVKINGYLTTISVKDSVTRIPGGYRQETP